jgi:hypothetical protein
VQAEERANRIQSAHSTLEGIYKEFIASLNAQAEDLALLVEAEPEVPPLRRRVMPPYAHDRYLVAAACKPSTGNYAPGIVNRRFGKSGPA